MAALQDYLRPVFEHIDQHRGEHLTRLIDYLRLPSISTQGIGMQAMADHLVAWLERLGMETELLAIESTAARVDAETVPGWPMIVGRRLDQPGAPTVILYGHYDVQPPEPLDKWVSPPFEPTIRDGRVYARGAGDNKGQHAAQLLALESLLAVHCRLPCNVIVLLEGEEEIGSPHLPDFVRAHRERLKADLVITSDGPISEDGQPTIEFGVRGVISFELRAHGANRDLHSGNYGGVAPNPLWTLVHLLGTMKNDRGQITIDGFYDNVEPLGSLEREAIERLPLDEDAIRRSLGLKQFDAPVDRPYFERLAGWPTLTINGLHGGYGGPGSKTVLPHEAVAKCDIRLVAHQTADEVYAKVVEHVRQHAPDVEVIWQGGMDPSKTRMDSPYAEPLRQAIRAAQGVDPLLMPAMGGSLPNYVFTGILGIPDFTVPYANADEANHAPNENIEVQRFHLGIRTGAAMLATLGQMPADTGA